jgi:hypothetical protein
MKKTTKIDILNCKAVNFLFGGLLLLLLLPVLLLLLFPFTFVWPLKYIYFYEEINCI